MFSLPRAIQGLIIFTTAFGVFFLWEVYPLLPTFVFDFVAAGWACFVVDSVLTFIRPRASYVLGLVLAILAMAVSLPQPEHYALIEGGDLTAAVILVVGTAAEACIVILVAYYFVSTRKEDPWAWPGAESQA
jgi:hypothetical protein